MADNYLEKRYNEVFGQKKTVKKIGHSLDTLLLQNRSTRGYKTDFKVILKQNERINKRISPLNKIQSYLK